MGSSPRGISASRGAAVLGPKGRYAKWRASHLDQDRARTRAYYHANKEKRKQDWQEYYAANSERLKEKARARRIEKREAVAIYNREYYQSDIENQRARAAAWKSANPDKARAFNARYYVRRRHTDPDFKLLTTLRNRINVALRFSGTRKSAPTADIVGCSIPELKAHLESQFLPGMSWSNHGKWHIDHIKPCALFNLTDPAQQSECFNYKNLQPLWAIDNIKKGAKYGITS